jgi:hypothetical protein
LHELMGWEGPMTHRQYLCWQEWLAQDLDRMDRTSYYLAGVICEVRRSYSKNPRKIQVKDTVLKFDRVPPKGKRKKVVLSEEKRAYLIAQSKAKWALIGAGSRRVRTNRQPPPGESKGAET